MSLVIRLINMGFCVHIGENKKIMEVIMEIFLSNRAY